MMSSKIPTLARGGWEGGVGISGISGILGSGSCCEGGFTVTTGESFIDFILEISSCKEAFLVDNNRL